MLVEEMDHEVIESAEELESAVGRLWRVIRENGFRVVHDDD